MWTQESLEQQPSSPEATRSGIVKMAALHFEQLAQNGLIEVDAAVLAQAAETQSNSQLQDTRPMPVPLGNTVSRQSQTPDFGLVG